MNPGNKFLIIIALLLAVVALSTIRRGSYSDGDPRGGGVCCSLPVALDARLMSVGTQEPPVAESPRQVIAYYFHGTVRCDTCLLMELLAQNVMEQQFQTEITAQRLVFLVVNYDLPENAHYRTRYGLPPPALVLVRQENQPATEWRRLEEIWSLVQDPPRFSGYVETQVREFSSDDGRVAPQLNAEPRADPPH